MKTDDLINAIAQDAAARLPSLPARLAAALAVGGLLALTLFAYDLGVRPDIASALQTWRFDAKLAVTVLCFAAALWAAARLVRPDADPRKALAAALLVPLLALVVAVGWELAVTPAPDWVARAVGSNSRLCVTSIIVLSIAPLAALLVAARAGAPGSPAMAGAAAGLLAGALAATLYAVHCPDDSPLFVLLWYMPTVALVAAAGAVAGHRLLRW
jgi:hypothetical protein